MPKPPPGSTLDTGHALAVGAVAVWPLLEGSGAASSDLVGSNDLTIGSGVNWNAAGGNAVLRFDGTAQRPVALDSRIVFTDAASWSIAFRANQRSSSSTKGLILGEDGDDFSFLFFFNSTRLRFRNTGDTDYDMTVTSTTTPTDYLVVFDSTAGTLTVYEDGVAITPVGATGNLDFDTIGSGYSSNAFALDGDVEYVYAWSRALSQSDAEAIDADPYDFLIAADPAVTLTVEDQAENAANTVRQRGIAETFSGTYSVLDGTPPTAIEYRYDGGSWSTLDAAPANGSFSGSVTLPPGNGLIEVRQANHTEQVASTWRTVGDVYVIFGQSNNSNRHFDQNDYTGGSVAKMWVRGDSAFSTLADPVGWDGGSDGSPWPLVANLHDADNPGVPIIFVQYADGGTALVDGSWDSETGPNYSGLVSALATIGVNGGTGLFDQGGERRNLRWRTSDRLRVPSRCDGNRTAC